MTGWNPRYVLYAADYSREPEAQMEADRERWPGGLMVGYICWIGARWADWLRLNPAAMRSHHTPADHQAFDAWLRLRAAAQ